MSELEKVTAVEHEEYGAAEIQVLEGLEADSQEIAEALSVICRQNDMTMEQLKPYYDAEFEKAVVRSVLSTKATKLIRDAAIITETA